METPASLVKRAERLENKVIILTGAAGGIGRVYARRLFDEGAALAAVDIQAERTSALVHEFDPHGERTLALGVDVTDEAATQEMARLVAERFGRIDVLVNNAGIFHTIPLRPFTEVSVDEWDRVMRVNVTGHFLCAKAVAPYLMAQKSGAIINTGSVVAILPPPGYQRLHYVTSKAAVIGMTRGLARELGPYNVTVNSIVPGSTLTPEVQAAYSEEFIHSLIARRCLQRSEYPEDLVGLLILLASDEGAFITGQTIAVDGGVVF